MPEHEADHARRTVAKFIIALLSPQSPRPPSHSVTEARVAQTHSRPQSAPPTWAWWVGDDDEKMASQNTLREVQETIEGALWAGGY